MSKKGNNYELNIFDSNFDEKVENLSNGGELNLNKLLDITSENLSNLQNSRNAATLAFEEIKLNNSEKTKADQYKNLSIALNKNKSSNIQISLENIDNADDVPLEKNIKNNFKIRLPFSPTPRRKEKIIYSKSNTKEIEEFSQLHSDDSQKTLKCGFKPKLMKDFKNHFKYKINDNVFIKSDSNSSNIQILSENENQIKNNSLKSSLCINNEIKNKNRTIAINKSMCIIY